VTRVVDFKGIIDFNKYTVAVAAASFVYALEKFVPMPTSAGRWFIVAVLLTFLASAILGVTIFAASTAAQHATQERKERLQKAVPRLGSAHAVLLCVGLLALGGMILERAMTAPGLVAAPQCCCTQPSDKPE
jgi:hypothetical protein